VTTYTRSSLSWGIVRITHPDLTHIDQTYTNEALPYFLKSRTNERGQTTDYERTDPNNPNAITKKIYPADQAGKRAFEEFSYNPFRQITKHRLTTGAYQHFAYDGRGLLMDKSNPTWNSDTANALANEPKTHFEYYTTGPWTDRVYRETDPRGNITQFEYDYQLNGNGENLWSATGVKVAGRGLPTRITYVSDTHGTAFPNGTTSVRPNG
jgi:hypothetical protein